MERTWDIDIEINLTKPNRISREKHVLYIYIYINVNIEDYSKNLVTSVYKCIVIQSDQSIGNNDYTYLSSFS